MSVNVQHAEMSDKWWTLIRDYNNQWHLIPESMETDFDWWCRMTEGLPDTANIQPAYAQRFDRYPGLAGCPGGCMGIYVAPDYKGANFNALFSLCPKCHRALYGIWVSGDKVRGIVQ